MNYEFAGPISIAFFALVWIILFLHKKGLRKEMIFMSIIIAPFGPIAELLHTKDYWHPIYSLTVLGIGLEDVLFAFLIGGISAVIYEEIFIKKEIKSGKKHSTEIAILSIIGVFMIIYLNLFLKINSIHASSIVFILVGFIMLFQRPDLLKNAVISGILVAMLMIVFYTIYISIFPNIIKDVWILDNLSNVLIFGAPIEEFTWAFSWGFCAGPIYEFYKGIKEK